MVEHRAEDGVPRSSVKDPVIIVDDRMPEMNGSELPQFVHEDPLLRCAQWILMSSVDQVVDRETLIRHRFVRSLSKPVRVMQLQECIDQVLIHSSEGSCERSQRAIARPSEAEVASKYVGAVLVVEDNPVNRKVAQRMLEKLGLRVTLAHDGEAGVDAFESGSFDLIFMDIQMPKLDGYAAARHIRNLELAKVRTLPSSR